MEHKVLKEKIFQKDMDAFEQYLEEARKSGDEKELVYALYAVGSGHYMDFKLKTACPFFQEALQLTPQFEEDYYEELVYDYAYCILLAGKHQETLDFLMGDIASHYEMKSDYQFTVALTYVYLKQFENAISHFLRVVEMGDAFLAGEKCVDAYTQLVSIYIQMGDLDEAERVACSMPESSEKEDMIHVVEIWRENKREEERKRLRGEQS